MTNINLFASFNRGITSALIGSDGDHEYLDISVLPDDFLKSTLSQKKLVVQNTNTVYEY